jgi:hypothetical protein
MRGLRAWLPIVGLAALAVAAVVDAVTGSDEDLGHRASTATAEARAADPATELGRLGATGTLYVTTRAGERCRFVALSLPVLTREADVRTELCRIQAAPDGPTVALGSPCPASGIQVRSAQGYLFERRLPGCSPAWTWDGRLTFLSRGAVRTPDAACSVPFNPCFRTILSAGAIERAIRRARFLPSAARYRIREIAWIDGRRLAAIVRLRVRFRIDFVVVFEGRRLARGTRLEEAPGSLSRLRVDSGAGRIVVRIDRARAGFSVYDLRGRLEGPGRPSFLADRAYARSPDGRWIAVASSREVYVFPAASEERPVDPVRIPLAGVEDLAWG